MYLYLIPNPNFSLSKKEIIEDLVDMIISEPEENSDEASKYKYSNLACEILTSDINQINNVLGDTDVRTLVKIDCFFNNLNSVFRVYVKNCFRF